MNLINKLNPFPEEITKVYGIFSNREDINNELNKEQSSFSFTIDLVNENMLDFDKKFIYPQDSEPSQHNLRPDNPKDALYIYFAKVNIDDFRLTKAEILSNLFLENKVYEFDLIPSSQSLDFEADKNIFRLVLFQ